MSLAGSKSQLCIVFACSYSLSWLRHRNSILTSLLLLVITELNFDDRCCAMGRMKHIETISEVGQLKPTKSYNL